MKAMLLRLAVILGATSLCGCSTVEEDWSRAQSANSIEAYEQFLKGHPKSEFDVAAHTGIEQLTEDLAFERAVAGHSADAYSDYLRAYPQGRFREVAVRAMLELDWRQAKSADAVEAYEEFLRKHPGSDFESQARVNIELLSDDLTFRRTVATASMDAYADYLRTYPEGRHAREALKAIGLRGGKRVRVACAGLESYNLGAATLQEIVQSICEQRGLQVVSEQNALVLMVELQVVRMGSVGLGYDQMPDGRLVQSQRTYEAEYLLRLSLAGGDGRALYARNKEGKCRLFIEEPPFQTENARGVQALGPPDPDKARILQYNLKEEIQGHLVSLIRDAWE